jgi:hypothetical protein
MRCRKASQRYSLSPRIARGEGARRVGEGRSSQHLVAALAPHPALRATFSPLCGEKKQLIDAVRAKQLHASHATQIVECAAINNPAVSYGVLNGKNQKPTPQAAGNMTRRNSKMVQTAWSTTLGSQPLNTCIGNPGGQISSRGRGINAWARLTVAAGWLILHGRYTCKARKPECWQCPIRDICRFKEKTPGGLSEADRM